MINWPIWIIGTVVVSVGVFLFYRSIKINEAKRPSQYVGPICPRCRQGFEDEELHELWQFWTAPLRLMGWNKPTLDGEGSELEVNELDALYCQSCRRKVNFVLVLSALITLPVVCAMLYAGGVMLGIIGES